MKEDKKKRKAAGMLKVKENKKNKKKKKSVEEFLPEEEMTEVWDPEDEETSYYDGEAYEQGYEDADEGYDTEAEYGDAEVYEDADEGYDPGMEYGDAEAYEDADEGYDPETEYDAPDEDTEAFLSEDLTGDEVLAESLDEDDYMDELIRSKKLENQPSLAQKRDRDEVALIREQERLAQEKRRKKRGKRRNIILGTVAAVLVVGLWFIGWGYSLIFGTSADTSTVEIVAESGQEIVYAKLTSVKGNEITYTVAEAVETADDAESTTEDGGMPSDTTEGMPSDSEMPSDTTEGTFSDGEMPEGFDSDNMPSGFDSENMPDGFDRETPSGETGDTDTETDTLTGDGLSSTGSVKASALAAVTTGSVTAQTASLTADISDSYTATSLGMGGGFGGGDMGGGGSFDFGSFDMDSFDFGSFGDSSSTVVTSSASDTFTYDNVTYQLTDESNTMLIPVGTDVTTRLGTVTTFSRLAAGDCVALILQEVDGEDVIMAVYIIG